MGTTEQRLQGNRLVDHTLRITAVIMAILTWGAYQFGEPIVRMATNARFSDYADILWLLVLGLGLFQLGQLSVLRGLNAARPGIYVRSKAVQALSFMVAALLLVKLFGMYGIAIALCVSSFCYLVMVADVNRRLACQLDAADTRPNEDDELNIPL